MSPPPPQTDRLNHFPLTTSAENSYVSAKLATDNLERNLTADFEPKGDLKEYHPNNGLFTLHRQKMWHAFQYAGANGLAQYIYRYGKDCAFNDSAFQHFIEDERAEQRVLPFLISTMHPDVVESLIVGDLSYRYENEAPFRSTVDRTTKMKTTPGIYLSQFYNIDGSVSNAATQTSKSSSSANSIGRGFSAFHLDILVGRVQKYLKDMGYARMIDQKIRSTHSGDVMDYQTDTSARRYCQNQHQREVIGEWMATVDEKILNKAYKHQGTRLWNKQTIWGIVSIGYGGNCKLQSQSHLENKGTSALFGLINAIVQEDQLFRAYRLRQVKLMYVCHPDHENLCEALCSVLASSFHDEGGLNGNKAGAVGTKLMVKSPGRGMTADATGYQDNILHLLNGGSDAYERGKEFTDERMARLQRWVNEERNEKFDTLLERNKKKSSRG